MARKNRGIAFPLLVYKIFSDYKINPRMWPLITLSNAFKTSPLT